MLRAVRTSGTRKAFTFQASKPAAHFQLRHASSPADSGQTGPQSSSPEAGQVNASRATDRRVDSPDTALTQQPASGLGQAGAAVSEEPQPSQENMKRDPNEPAESKRQAVEKEGRKPLDPADR